MDQGFTLWFTGLSGAGKSTLANLAAEELRSRAHRVEILDGDEVRTNLSKGLGFSKEDRDINIRRIGYVCHLLSRNGVIAISAAISPYREIRDEVRRKHDRFFEVYVRCTIDKLVERDVKGLYKKALAGEIKSFTGVSDPYEEPLKPELVVDSSVETVDQSLGKLIGRLEELSYINRGRTAMSVRDDAIGAHGGGELVDLKAPASERAALAAHAAKLASVTLNARDLADLEMLATGAFSPLTGFMGEADYTRSRDEMRLASGAPWSIPITLGVDEATAKSLKTGNEIALATEDGKRLAILKLAEIYKVDRKLEAQNVFGTAEDAHPGAKNVTSMPPYCIAGKVTLVEEIPGRTFLEFPREPRQTRAAFRERGWKKIVAFQTRNPTHRAHEYIQKAALEICDGLMIHPLVGETKGDDVPAAVRMETYKVLLDLYYPKNRAMIGVFPAHMRYGGPREAILHAIARRNYGCTHFIVGRDHAGVGSYYGSYDAQKIFERFAPAELGITPLMFENTFYCKRCNAMASFKTCPHTDADRLILSGTKVREMLRAGEAPPPEFTRPELAAILVRAMRETK